MKKVRLYESFHGIDEAKRGTIHKAVKAGDYPATIVVIENGKVVHQEQVSTPEAVPASFNVLQKEYPKAKLHVEDKGGQTLFTENLEEAYDGNMADFKYEFPQVFVDVTGNPEKAIKKIKKSGKGFEVRTATYMSEPEMEEVADALGMVLVNYEKHSNMAISVFESVVNEAKSIKVTKKEWPYVEFKIGSTKHKVEFDYEDIIDDHGNEGQDQYWLGKDDDGKEWSIDVYADYNGDVQDVHYDTIVAESVVNEAKSIAKIQKEWSNVIVMMKDTVADWKKAEGQEKSDLLDQLKVLTAAKKKLEMELDDVVGLTDVDAELVESVNESILHGSYYFPKAAVSSDMQPAKGETKYAVICHNTVQMGKNIMYLKGASSNIGQNFEGHVMSTHDTEQEAEDAFTAALKSGAGKTQSCVSFAYGTLTSKGSNLPFEEIGGKRKEIK